MYATFAGFQLNSDGSVAYTLAAHSPILHLTSTDSKYLALEQFPIGLLPVDRFWSETTTSTPGDLFISLTEAEFLEASNKAEEEFGFDQSSGGDRRSREPRRYPNSQTRSSPPHVSSAARPTTRPSCSFADSKARAAFKIDHPAEVAGFDRRA